MKVPPPDLTQTPTHLDFAVAEVIYAEDKQVRAVVTKDRQNLYRVFPEFWDVSDLETIGEAYWNRCDHQGITDDIEIAHGIAQEILRTTPRSKVLPYVDE